MDYKERKRRESTILSDYALSRDNIQAAYELRYIDYEKMANMLREARSIRDSKIRELDEL